MMFLTLFFTIVSFIGTSVTYPFTTMNMYPWEIIAIGYAAFSYSAKERHEVIEYIKNQKEHHKNKGFREEYEEWLNEMGMELAQDRFLQDD